MSDGGPSDISIKIDGAEEFGEGQLASSLLSVEWRNKYNTIPSGEIVLSDFTKAAYSWHGKSIEVKIDERTPIKGEIVRVRHAMTPDGDYRCVLEFRSKPWRMAMGSAHKSYLEQSTSDIVSACISDAGCSKGSVESTSTKHEYVLQANESNLGFIARLLEDEGHLFWVDEEEKVSTSAAVKFSGGAKDVQDMVKSASMEHRQTAEGVDVRGWFTGAEPESQSGTAPNGETSMSVGTIFERSPSVAKEMAEPWKKAAIARIEGDRTMVQATIIDPPEIALGDKVKFDMLTGARHERTSALEVGVTELTLRLNQDDGLTISVVGVEVSNEDATKHLASEYLPPRTAPRPVLGGVFRAIVVDVKDPDDNGRVKVKFPTLDEATESFWAPYVQTMAGAKRGAVFYPCVDDEVIVVFENGDPRFPVVIGSVWNGKDQPLKTGVGTFGDESPPHEDIATKYLNGDNIAAVSIMSDLGEGRNEISVFDNVGEEQIYLHAHKDLVAEIDQGAETRTYNEGDRKTTFMKGNDELLLEAGDLSIEATQGEIKIEAGTKITLVVGENTVELSTSGITIESASGPVEIKGLQTKVEAQTQGEYKASAMLKVESSGIAEIKGSLLKLN